MKYIIEIVANLFGKTTQKNKLGMSIIGFTNETWFEQINRQGKLIDYLYHGKK